MRLHDLNPLAQTVLLLSIVVLIATIILYLLVPEEKFLWAGLGALCTLVASFSRLLRRVDS